MSLILTVSVLNFDSTLGGIEGFGEIRRFLKVSCGCSIYSSKVKVIVLVLKPLLESGGDTFKRRGGSESLSPPVGGIMLAQPVRATIFVIKKIRRKKGEITFIKILRFIKRIANLNSLHLITALIFLIILKNHVNHGALIMVRSPLLPFHAMELQGY